MEDTLKESVFFCMNFDYNSLKIYLYIKSTEYCDFYCGPQPVAKEKPEMPYF